MLFVFVSQTLASTSSVEHKLSGFDKLCLGTGPGAQNKDVENVQRVYYIARPTVAGTNILYVPQLIDSHLQLVYDSQGIGPPEP